eukprot:scaffold88891_cov55-Phaeocystis_antarctica.AAC.13
MVAVRAAGEGVVPAKTYRGANEASESSEPDHTGRQASDYPQPHSLRSSSTSRLRAASTRRSRMSSLKARRSSCLALCRCCDRPSHP